MRGARFPRLIVAGTHSGVGKTTVALGLVRAARARGLRVQPFKAGPDYIDPGYHTEAAGRACRNLDSWLLPKACLPLLFERACAGADLALIEGVMGLHDGRGATGEEGSTAELARRLRAPVILVLDASALSRSAAAIVRGFRDFDRRVRIAGCFLNRVAGEGHARLVREGIERLTGVPVLGFLPQDDGLSLPERHLGLVPRQEREGWRAILRPLAQAFREGVDLDRVLRVARDAGPLPQRSWRGIPVARHDACRSRVPIAVAMDEAFHFYYPENLELIEALGGRVVPFSPLRDRRLPEGTAGLYVGGGFPEEHARGLSRNRGIHREIRRGVEAGMPTYAECGGLMFLARSIADRRGRRFPMVGLLPAEVRMTDRLQRFGYKELRALRSSVLARRGETARGHEFHHSVALGMPVQGHAAYRAASAGGDAAQPEGYARGNVLASYVHLHFWSQPRWVARFVEAARRWSNGER